ncbi:MAG: 50S ribosomal protein L19 [Candidatus Ratteibacteria bacterium]|nr:50S ribosomal protein L19 [Candidatus Ratteibacteria bacterium]
MNKLQDFEKAYLKTELPSFSVGDTVEVDFTIREGEKTRLQTFIGIVIRRQNKGVSETFTVRKISYGEGVERTFPLHSPGLKSVRVVKKSKVRRAKLYYLRKKIGKKAKLKERQGSGEPVVIKEEKPAS